MTRTDRRHEIEKLWRRKPRDTGFGHITEWEEIQWEPMVVDGVPFKLNIPEILKKVEARGYYFWCWGFAEEAFGGLEWDWALLEILHNWYCFPEDCESPFFVDEAVGAVCIPDPHMASTMRRLFDGPGARLLGMDVLKERLSCRTCKNAQVDQLVLGAKSGADAWRLLTA